ncbi:MAG: hypothetical protein KKF30_09550 [Proteobacteria bacterium]|nr:hypothetical protein [Pseudomonadota bacterium]MBU4470645.1 hypothetical protein [Pseudomonadota bacterium]MCG2753370.1 hypothetical protein [Desulfobacteraceae bacterium]
MKKKLFLVTVLLGALLVFPGMMVSTCFAEDDSAMDQLEDADENSSEAADDTSLEGARDEAGVTFDTPDEDPPPVDLSGAGDNPTPDLLRNEDGSNPYTPEEYKTVRPSTVPPLP